MLRKSVRMISIIVPVYNAKSYILETIRMVTSQTEADWELILVDDCSTDGSREVIKQELEKRCDVRIRLILQEKNQGAAAARNRGLSEAKGRYIAFLDADDVWIEEKLSRQLKAIKEKNAGFLFTSYEFGDEEAKGTGKIVHAPASLTYQQALSRTVIFTSTVLFDTEKIDKKLLHMPNIPSEDSATWWQILRAGHVAYGLDAVTCIYRRPKKSLSSNKGKAIARIWYLYRKVEKLSLIKSSCLFVGWAIRATLRRV